MILFLSICCCPFCCCCRYYCSCFSTWFSTVIMTCICCVPGVNIMFHVLHLLEFCTCWHMERGCVILVDEVKCYCDEVKFCSFICCWFLCFSPMFLSREPCTCLNLVKVNICNMLLCLLFTTCFCWVCSGLLCLIFVLIVLLYGCCAIVHDLLLWWKTTVVPVYCYLLFCAIVFVVPNCSCCCCAFVSKKRERTKMTKKTMVKEKFKTPCKERKRTPSKKLRRPPPERGRIFQQLRAR